jgi:ATP-dependent helicase HrpA
MALGTRRLLLLQLPSPAKTVLGRLDNAQKLALASAPHPSPSALFDDCLAAAVDALVEDGGGPAWRAADFAQLLTHVRGRLEAEVTQVVRQVAGVLTAAADVDRRLRGTSSLVLLPALTDVRQQVSGLVHPGFVAATGVARLPDVARYLRAAVARLDALPERPERDRQLMWRVELVQQSYDAALAALPPGRQPGPELAGVRWMIEELRVSFFAQQLGTAYPISEKRIQKVLAEHHA